MMYLISYDLDKPGQNYDRVEAAIRALGGTRVLMSQWAVNRTGTTVEALRDYMMKHIDTNDRLLVNQLGNWAAYNLLADPNKL